MQWLIAVQISHPFATIVSWVALAAVSVVVTVGYLGFETSQRSLISPGDRMMQLLKMADRFSDLEGFVVAVENRDTHRTLQFAGRLTKKLEADREHYEQVFARVDPASMRRWALLYLSERELADLGENLRDHKASIEQLARSPRLDVLFDQINNEISSGMVGELFTGFLEDKKANKSPMDLRFLIRTLRQMKGFIEGVPAFASPWESLFRESGTDESEEGYFWTEGNRYLLIFVQPRLKGDFSTNSRALQALRETVAAVKADYPDVNAGVTGQKALDEDEKQIAMRDIGIATCLSLVGLAALLIVFWRGVRRPLLAVAVLVVALCVTFGITTLAIGHLNLLSVTFAPMLLGLGIDYGVHWFARYAEERQRFFASTRQALSATMEQIGPAIFLAGVCASLSFFPLVLTGFKGLSELGLICSIGLLVATLATLSLLPAMIMLTDGFRTGLVRKPVTEEIRPLLKTTRLRTFLLLSFALCASVLSLWGIAGLKFDLNMLHLQSRSAESVIWENKLIQGSRYASIYGVLFAHSLGQIDEQTKAVERLPTVSKANSIKSVLPSDQERKLRMLQGLRPVLGDIRTISVPSDPVDIDRLDGVFSRIRFKILDPGAGASDAPGSLARQMREVRRLIDDARHDFATMKRPVLAARLKAFEVRMIEDLNDKLSLLWENIETRPLRPEDLPKPLYDRFVGPGSLYILRIFPSGNVWDPQFLDRFVADLRSVDPDATGDPITLSVFTKAFRNACIMAAVYAVIFIVLVLAATLRSPIPVAAALAPLVLGTLWTLGLMHVFGIDLNLANTIFMPLVVGAGVEYGIIVVQRWRQSSDRAGFSLPISTGTGVILAGLSTTVGFCSLIISTHQGIRSLGVLTTIGSLCVLAAAVLFLPAILHASANIGAKGRRSPDRHASAGKAEGARLYKGEP
jgi:hypothetical protein